MDDLFSKRYGLQPTPAGLMYDAVPQRARIGLSHIADHFNLSADEYQRICEYLRIPRDRKVEHYNQAQEAISKIIMNCEWWQFYDLCEITWRLVGKNLEREDKEYEAWQKEEFSLEVDALFKDEGLGFEFKEGKVEKVGSDFINAQIQDARYLLKEPEFKGADEHFEKAIKALNERPKPDVENCIKDAVSAIESVGRIITNDKKALLSDIIKGMIKRSEIPKLIGDTIQKIYAYRGDEPGVAHGLVGDSKVTEEEADFALAVSAAAIIYLVKKYKEEELP